MPLPNLWRLYNLRSSLFLQATLRQDTEVTPVPARGCGAPRPAVSKRLGPDEDATPFTTCLPARHVLTARATAASESGREGAEILDRTGERKKGPAIRRLREEPVQQWRRARIAQRFLSGEWGVELEGFEAEQERDHQRDAATAPPREAAG